MFFLNSKFNTKYNTDGGSEECVKFLLSQVESLEKVDTRKENGFVGKKKTKKKKKKIKIKKSFFFLLKIAKPFGKNLFHWFIRIFGNSLGVESNLGVQLLEWSLCHSNINDNSSRIQPKDIVLELLFPSDFPSQPPMIRIASPRFIETNLELSGGLEKMVNVSQAVEEKLKFSKILGIIGNFFFFFLFFFLFLFFIFHFHFIFCFIFYFYFIFHFHFHFLFLFFNLTLFFC